MPSALQQIVDSLNRRLRCPIVIDDTNRILSRSGDPSVAAYFWSFRDPLPEWPIRIPARPDIGVTSRVYMPICYQGELLGHFWAFDADGVVREADFQLVHAAAESAGLILNREKLLSDLERSRERELLRDLLSTEPSLRAHASHELVSSELFVAAAPVQAIVIQPFSPSQPEPDGLVRTAMGRAMDNVRQELTPGHVLHLVRNDHGLMIVSDREPSLRWGGAARIADDLRRALSESLPGDSDWQTLAAIGQEQHSLSDAHLSYEEARQAIKVMRVVPSFGCVAEWGSLGIYRLLSQFPVGQLSRSALHPGLTQLIEHEEAGQLVRTLECYLDSGCDAKASAAEMFIHRGTLYYRLKRISQLTGADLNSGEDRLALHLSLKLGRLTGLLETPP
jgi:sugar diacid utilization regulator